MTDQVNATVIDVDDGEEENRRPWWLYAIIVLVILLVIVGLVWGAIRLFGRNGNQMASPAPILNAHGEEVVSWKDAISYPAGGSGPADPSSVFESDQTAVDHNNRLIVENPDLAVRECFPDIDDDTWKTVVVWADQWGSDSPTRIEWQTNESRCSFVFPGNITDSISAQEYEDLLKMFPRYETWFVGGEEGAEFGRETYEAIYAVDTTFNRVHVYGPTLSSMPIK